MQATSGPLFEGVHPEGRNDKAAKEEVSLLRKLRESLNKRFEVKSAGVVAVTKLASFNNWPENAAAGLFSVKQHQHIFHITRVGHVFHTIRTGQAVLVGYK